MFMLPRRRWRLSLENKARHLSRRTTQLDNTWLRSLMGRHVDFSAVTADALDYALGERTNGLAEA
jgi:hypothetical protein